MLMKRVTRQYRAILEAFQQSMRPLSVQELLTLASQSIPEINLSTVYRNLKRLLEQKRVHAIDVAGSTVRYELANLPHHHHFLCQQCNRLFDILGCPKELLALVPTGFTLVSHSITLHGQCPSCFPPVGRSTP